MQYKTRPGRSVILQARINLFILKSMADQLYLSLWYANFRFDQLPLALERVLRQFSLLSLGEGMGDQVHAATVYPLGWNESPCYQWVHSDKDPAEQAHPAVVIARATELLHSDYAYEFEMRWPLWVTAQQSDSDEADSIEPAPDALAVRSDMQWREEPRIVRVTGFGPEFDSGSFEQNGQIRIDLGSDTPFLQEDLALDAEATAYIRRNVQRLVDLTSTIQKNAGAASHLLWSESGENLAQKLMARLQQLN